MVAQKNRLVETVLLITKKILLKKKNDGKDDIHNVMPKTVHLVNGGRLEGVDTVMRHWYLPHNYALSQSLHMYA